MSAEGRGKYLGVDDALDHDGRCWNCPAVFVIGEGYGEPVESQVFCSEPCAAQFMAELGV